VRIAIKHNFAFLCFGDAVERGTFELLLNIKYFMQTARFRWSAAKLMWPLDFPSFSCGPLEICCGPMGDIWPVLRTTGIENVQSTSRFYYSSLLSGSCTAEMKTLNFSLETLVSNSARIVFYSYLNFLLFLPVRPAATMTARHVTAVNAFQLITLPSS